MKTRVHIKRLLITVTLLSSLNTYAGVCNNGSLIGRYNFSGMGVSFGESFHFIGQIFFDGAGSATLSGINTNNVRIDPIKGNGAYSILPGFFPGCLATGSINLNIGIIVFYWLYLDQMDFSPATNLAYHATLAIRTNLGDSASGELNRVQGKFQ
ncbi:MAG: hypothetical protein L0Y39_08250 [Methylococcaceae bacterium]|nr:hypothetical protein [Methylococcaceae bacterium]